MSDASSDDFPGMNFSEFSAQDFAQIDAIAASHSRNRLQDNTTTAKTFNAVDAGATFKSHITEEPVEVDGGYSDVETLSDIVTDVGIADADISFNSDGFDLNLSALTADELAKLDGESSDQNNAHNGGPSITIEFEEAGDAAGMVNSGENNRLSNVKEPSLAKSPLDEFRSYMSLSVTDLVSPAWCEVQYDYGLRGKRNRPISHRPKSFVSSTGKTISPEVTIALTNDVRTRQGLAVHKELEREIKFEELQVEITTDETRWALRIVNMLACLKSIISGLTREMPVFGILHGEVVVGIMDEVIKEEVTFSKTNMNRNNKRPSSGPRSPSNSKKARTEPPSPQTRIDSFFESPKKPLHRTETTLGETSPSPSPSPKPPGYMLHIKDNKTRKNKFIPSEPDMFSGRMQLMIYRKLLSELVSTNPPYDFSLIWRKVNVDSTAIFPTKFLVQAHLIEDTDGFKSTCLDDLVALWQSEVKELNILGVDPNLELVYRLRPPPGTTVKSQIVNKTRPPQTISDEERDLKLAIAASLEGTSEVPRASVASCPPTSTNKIAASRFAEKPDSDFSLDVEDVEMQWAIAESNRVSKHPIGAAVYNTQASERETRKRGNSVDKGKGKEKEHTEIPEEEGIRRFKIIGTKKFRHNDEELDRYLNHVLGWWRGERKPEGVPLERVNRCSTCEYINDCEWRDQKALELSKKKRATLS